MTFIPAQYYTTLFFQLLLLVVVGIYIQSLSVELTNKNSLKAKNTLGVFLLFLLTFYIGVRPVNFRFGDMVIYNMQFQDLLNGAPPTFEKDVLFEYIMYICSKTGSVTLFFFVCTVIYFLPLYFAVKKMFNDYWFYAFFMLIISFSFWSYGVNGIRNGMATSIFIFALSRTNKYLIISLLLLSVLMHKSMLLPMAGYIITLVYNNPKYFIIYWFVTIPLSLILGGFFINFFLTLGVVEEDRLAGYLGTSFNATSEGVELKTGFRWDFLLYSASGVFAGWYFIFKKKFQDIFYNRLYNIYLFTNGFWVLVINANYSNRFAYLSWFLLGLVIIYPLLKNYLFEKQHIVIGRIILLYFAFTYLMNIILI